MIKKTIRLLLGVALLLVAQCKEKAHQEKDLGHHQNHMQTKTKVVVVDDIQVAFDLMTLEKHNKMMKSMNMNGSQMHHEQDSNHAMSLSILDKTTKKPIKGAEVTITMNHSEDNSSVSRKGTIMQGGGMYHYGADFKMHKSGTCTFIAKIKVNDKSYEAKADFQMKH